MITVTTIRSESETLSVTEYFLYNKHIKKNQFSLHGCDIEYLGDDIKCCPVNPGKGYRNYEDAYRDFKHCCLENNRDLWDKCSLIKVVFPIHIDSLSNKKKDTNISTIHEYIFYNNRKNFIFKIDGIKCISLYREVTPANIMNIARMRNLVYPESAKLDDYLLEIIGISTIHGETINMLSYDSECKIDLAITNDFRNVHKDSIPVKKDKMNYKDLLPEFNKIKQLLISHAKYTHYTLSDWIDNGFYLIDSKLDKICSKLEEEKYFHKNDMDKFEDIIREVKDKFESTLEKSKNNTSVLLKDHIDSFLDMIHKKNKKEGE